MHLLVNQVRKPVKAARCARSCSRWSTATSARPGRAVRLDLLGEVPPTCRRARHAVQRRQLLLDALPGAPAAIAHGGGGHACC
jgi:flagellar biosynthesis protein FlhG